MDRRNKLLYAILTFNAATALVGGLGLLSGFVSPPSSWIDQTFLHSYVVPGLVLFFVVGGSAAFASHAVLRNRRYYQLASGISGLCMMTWILTEIAVIRHFNLLQGLYYITGYLTISLAYPSTRHYPNHHPKIHGTHA